MGLSLLAALILLAAWVSVHTVLCYYLAHLSLGRAALAFAIFPLAPLWGRSFRKLSIAWTLCFLSYGVALVIATLIP